MENNAHKEIKVYGTLLNLTINTNPNGTNSELVDNAHSDYLTVAYQLYDSRFEPKKGSGTNFAVLATDRYQDNINKRLTAIYFDKTDDLDANDNPKEGITYIDSDLNVSGDTNIEGDTTIEGDLTVNGVINYNFNVDKDLAELGDVTLSSNLDNKILRHGVGGDWVDGTLEDILPSATEGQVLKYNGTDWVAGEDISEQGSLSSIEIVTVTGQWIRSSQSEYYSAFYAMQESDTNNIINAYVTITYEGDIRKLDVLWRSKYSDFGNQSGYYTPNYPDSVVDVTIAPKFQFFKVRQ